MAGDFNITISVKGRAETGDNKARALLKHSNRQPGGS